jgi:hypothetical protein
MGVVLKKRMLGYMHLTGSDKVHWGGGGIGSGVLTQRSIVRELEKITSAQGLCELVVFSASESRKWTSKQPILIGEKDKQRSIGKYKIFSAKRKYNHSSVKYLDYGMQLLHQIL